MRKQKINQTAMKWSLVSLLAVLFAVPGLTVSTPAYASYNACKKACHQKRKKDIKKDRKWKSDCLERARKVHKKHPGGSFDKLRAVCHKHYSSRNKISLASLNKCLRKCEKKYGYPLKKAIKLLKKHKKKKSKKKKKK